VALRFQRGLRLPAGEFFDTAEPKSGICIHHTVGGSAESTYKWWLQDRGKDGAGIKVGTSFIIDGDGTVFEVFDPRAWAYQFGLPWVATKKIAFEKRFIGIEIASEGALIEQDGQLYCFDRVSDRTKKPRTDAFDYGQPYRGYRYFDRYEEPQIAALIELINLLCDQHAIPRDVPDGFLDFHGERLADFKGIIGHTMVRTDKTDPLPDVAFWNRVAAECRLRAIPASPAPVTPGGRMNDLDVEALFLHNAAQIDQLNVAAGGVVSALLAELEAVSRSTYIRLRNPVKKGHKVEYELVKGDRRLVGSLARALGFKTITDTTLEVHGG
jgi:hypothetical protein